MYELLSLDLWDTVIRRKCHPDTIKQKTSEYLLNDYYELVKDEYRDIIRLTELRVNCERTIGRELTKTGKDDEYEIHDVFEKWIDSACRAAENKDSLVRELYEAELNEEIKNAYIDSHIVQKVSDIPHRKLAYVSDFYAGTEFIDAILKAISCPLAFDGKFISCEYGYNKRSGRLFDTVLSQYKIEPEKQFHLGDNEYSDVTVPIQMGIAAERYLPEDEHNNRLSREEHFVSEQKKLSENLHIPPLSAKGNISVFFYGFIKWIADSCMRDGICKIYFFTREGEFYKQLYDEYVRNSSAVTQYPEAEILEVSRVATFCASLRDINLNEFMRIWNMYSSQSLSALFKSLGIEKNVVSVYADRYGIPWDEVIVYPWLDERVIKLFKDEEFICAIKNERDSKRKLICQYMNQKGLSASGSGKIAIVDIGWRGTIQDNIGYLLPNYVIKGFYIGLLPFLNEQPENVIKRGYLNGYSNFDLLLRYVMPFEMICNSPNGSTTGYRMEGGNVAAVRKKEKEEDKVYYEYTKDIQNDVIKDMGVLTVAFDNCPYVSCRIRLEAHKILSRYILYPQRVVTQAYFSLKHNEEFGIGEYVDKTTKLRLDLFIKAPFRKKWRSELSEFLGNTTWPQGYFTKYHLYPLLRIYNKRYER